MSEYDTEELVEKINDGTATVEEIKAWMVQPCVSHRTMDAKAMNILLARFDEQAAELDALKDNGVLLIAQERDRQQRVEGFDDSHDNQWTAGQLAEAAAYYALPSPRDRVINNLWPWGESWNKKHKHNRIRQLMIAGALIAAEIDRLKRSEDDHAA